MSNTGGEYMNSALKVISTIIEKFKLRELILAVLIVCCAILFVPDDFISILGLERWRDEYRSIIGLILLFCAVCCLIWLLSYLKSRLLSRERLQRKRAVHYLKNVISSQEKEFLIRNFYNDKTNEFDKVAYLDMRDGHIVPLANAYILTIAAEVGAPSCWAYMVQPNIRLYLKKALKRKKIQVTKQE